MNRSSITEGGFPHDGEVTMEHGSGRLIGAGLVRGGTFVLFCFVFVCVCFVQAQSMNRNGSGGLGRNRGWRGKEVGEEKKGREKEQMGKG